MANDNDDHGQPSTSTASTTTNQRKIKKHLPLVNRSTSEIVRTYQKRFDSTIDDYNDDDDNHNHNNDKRKQQQRSFDETFIIEDNVDGKMINYNNNNRIKTNRPPNSRWKQQRLPAWQPILKPTSVLISFILFGLFCIVIGVVMFISNQKIQEIIIDYTDCHRINPITNINQCEYCRDRWKFKWENCECLLNFTITESIDGPLFLYYSLNGFYQNHRRYVASIDRRQLMGEKRSLEQIRSDCYPYSDIDGKIIAPCGAIANSMFSDTFQLRRIVQNNHDDQPEKIHIWEKDISWPTDRQNLYQNPSDDNFQSYAKPINWSQNLYDDTILNKKNEAGFGYINEHFMVWMRPAAFPIFRKLWGRIDCRSLNNNNNIDQLPKGSYQLLINYG
ncbi:LOW QUALITY PROTEIN: cell cycle control protein 50A-like [Dermatophagoides pteronyssinus]|uniref:LOW QUALITY PROTEIN: cell cycle control protein 50A-like n=1 Tax=Dermatophagoides pteronyssinus TaxID=6956 RepID=UPI003F667190